MSHTPARASASAAVMSTNDVCNAASRGGELVAMGDGDRYI